MGRSTFQLPRRAVLQSVTGFAIGHALATPAAGQTTVPVNPGKPGDFDWLTGEWHIKHRQLKKDAWDEFEGEATCWSVLGGVGHVEELRIPARDFSGMGLRLLDLEKTLWSDFWVNAKSGQLGGAGLIGGFANGEGIFESVDETDKAKIYRGVWDRIVPGKTHRWYQAWSDDGGKTWKQTWLMDWTRVGDPRWKAPAR